MSAEQHQDEPAGPPGDSARERTLAGLLFPFGIMLVLLFATGAGLTWFAASSQDNLTAKNTHQILRSALKTNLQNLTQMSKDYAYWDEMVANIVTDFDKSYAARQSTYLAENFAVTSVHFFDAEGGNVYAWMDGTEVADDPLENFSDDIWSIIARARDSANDAVPTAVEGYAGDGKAAYFIGASQLTDYDSAADVLVPRGTDWVLVLTRRLDADLLTEIAGNFGIDGLRFVAPGVRAADDSGLALGKGDDVVGHLAWEPKQTGRDLIVTLIPVLGLTMALSAGFTVIFYRRGRDIVSRFRRELRARTRAQESLGRALEDVKAAKTQAELASNAKSAFLSSMSHELRTPLNAVVGFSQLLRDYSDELLTGEQAEYVHQIVVAGDLLNELIEDVLDLSKIEEGRIEMSLAPVAVGPVIEECLEMVANAARDRGITINAEASGTTASVVADAVRLKQVSLNVLSNAVKYNRDGGTVSVETSIAELGILRITVQDTGIGIPADRREEVFEPFSRLGAESTAVPGTGIGLTISRQLIGLMGGRMDFDSVVNDGSRFWIEIPLAERLAPSA